MAFNGNICNLAIMAKAAKPKKKQVPNITVKTSLTADELLQKMLNTPIKKKLKK